MRYIVNSLNLSIFNENIMKLIPKCSSHRALSINVRFNEVDFSRYSSNVNVCCLKHSFKLCNRVFRFTNNFFHGGNILVAK